MGATTKNVMASALNDAIYTLPTRLSTVNVDNGTSPATLVWMRLAAMRWVAGAMFHSEPADGNR